MCVGVIICMLVSKTYGVIMYLLGNYMVLSSILFGINLHKYVFQKSQKFAISDF